MKLPPPEQERLGFNYFLFQKLQELVRSGDRTVARNKEKLAQELRRLAAKRGANQPVVDYVQDVDEQAIEAMARNQLEFEFLQKQLQGGLLTDLDELQEEEDNLKQQLSALLASLIPLAQPLVCCHHQCLISLLIKVLLMCQMWV